MVAGSSPLSPFLPTIPNLAQKDTLIFKGYDRVKISFLSRMILSYTGVGNAEKRLGENALKIS